MRAVVRVWYLAFLIYPTNVVFNLYTLVGHSGLAILEDWNSVAQALLLDQLLRVLVQDPLIVAPVLLLVGGMIWLGRLAHLDADREHDAALRVSEREALDRVVVDAGREGERAGESAARRILERYSGTLVPSPEPPSSAPQGPPFDLDVLPRSPHFVGRVAELDELLARLRAGGTTSIVALEGIGGIGKTTVAAQAIHYLWLEAAFPDGIAVVLAENKTNGILVLREVLARFDPQRRQPAATTPSELRQAVHRMLDGKRVLVVIDNVEPGLDIEQVVGPLAEVGATVLLTARQALPVGDPLVLDLLSQDEAVELFAQEYGAGAARDLGPSQLAAIERIVTALGRHTLAVKLAARYAFDTSHDLRVLAQELEDDPRGVVKIPGTSQERIVLIFAKSARALQPAVRRLFAALSVFATAEFGMEAARALAAGLGIGAEDRQPFLDLLVRRALVARTRADGAQEGSDSDRLRMHPVLRAFSRDEFETLSSLEQERAMVSVAEHYATYATQADRDVLGLDEQNIAGALEWAHAHQRITSWLAFAWGCRPSGATMDAAARGVVISHGDSKQRSASLRATSERAKGCSSLRWSSWDTHNGNAWAGISRARNAHHRESPTSSGRTTTSAAWAARSF
jgi:hypothetical protein